MLALLIYSYAMGTISGREIELSTQESVPVHCLCADTHPRPRLHLRLLPANWRSVRQKTSTESSNWRPRQSVQSRQYHQSDGRYKILANASKQNALTHGHALEQMRLLEDEIAALLAFADVLTMGCSEWALEPMSLWPHSRYVDPMKRPGAQHHSHRME